MFLLKPIIVIAGLIMVPGLILAVVLFCRAKGTWKERLKMFGGGT